jgi:hypothetical protein
MRFTSKQIKHALQELEKLLGRATVEAMIYDLEMYGLPLVNDRQTYTLNEIENALRKIFGDEATLLLFERLKKSLFGE